ncbi:MAG: response regulator [Nitrospinaceae bacterium]|nr:response regulator [Nitrospinaceae bacterium]
MVKKILVADDSITIQKIVAMAFEKEDAVVEGISNGKEAFERIGDFNPDIVLADVDMPGLTGFELSKKIKADPEFDSVKVLLLASDFEDFNESLFNESGADDHILKPFKSDNIVKKVVDLISKDSAETAVELSPADEEGDPVFDLSEADMIEAVEPAEAAVGLSADNVIGQKNEVTEVIEPAADEIVKSAPATELTQDNDISLPKEEEVLDEMIKDVESLTDMTEPVDVHSDYEELSEVAPTEEDKIGEELDTAFQEIVNFGSGEESVEAPGIRQEPIADPSVAVDNIIPEPEDLLEKMTPSALARKKGVSGPNLIQESLSYLSQASLEPKSHRAMASHRNEHLKSFSGSVDTEDEHFVRVVGEHVKHILENSLHTSIEEEIAGLSESITQSVREVVREITPQIAREIIKEEIDKIKKV